MAGQNGTPKPTGKPWRPSEKLVVPDNVLKWKIRKLQTAQRVLAHNLIAKPGGNFNIGGYCDLLDKIAEALRELERENDKHSHKGVVAKQVQQAGPGRPRKEKLPGLDSGVLPADLITG